MPSTPGTRLGAYEILSPLGAGGVGEVYRVSDTKLNRDVALKILPDSAAQDPERLARLKREAQVLAALDFGLAKLVGPAEAGRHAEPGGVRRQADMTRSPTLSLMATEAGMILGTAAYMSPEQAKGFPTDQRTDVSKEPFARFLNATATSRQTASNCSSSFRRRADGAIPPSVPPGGSTSYSTGRKS